MGILNHNYVCFECRKAIRRAPYREEKRLCPRCGVSCHSLGDTIPIPPRSAKQEWKLLRDWYFDWHRECRKQRQKDAVQRKHRIEQRLAELEKAKPDRAREFWIERLNAELDELQQTAPEGIRIQPGR